MGADSELPQDAREILPMSTASRTALIVAAGTGGHLYPGIAAAKAIVSRGPGWKVIFVVRRGDMGKTLLEREGFDVLELSGQGLPRALSWKTLLFPWRVLEGFVQAWSALGRIQPQVVLGMGGYLSFPVLLAARLKGIKTLIHEQNVLAGLSNRVLSKLVDSVAVSFAESRGKVGQSGVWVSGLPIRPEIGKVDPGEARQHWGFDEDRMTFLIFGGSLGAQRINRSVVGAWEELASKADQFQVLHVTGEKDFETVKALYARLPVKANLLPYCHDMASAYAVADLVICRAGASTIAELLVTQRPAILVPYPFASENHQFYNAGVLARRGAAEVILDQDLNAARLAAALKPLLDEPERLQRMRDHIHPTPEDQRHSGAAEQIADYILKQE